MVSNFQQWTFVSLTAYTTACVQSTVTITAFTRLSAVGNKRQFTNIIII
uniref:Uncharacterized protein n=1 Tax=Arundo donax TaxID=35708 RepID=A0A0A9GSN6_ARUDO